MSLTDIMYHKKHLQPSGQNRSIKILVILIEMKVESRFHRNSLIIKTISFNFNVLIYAGTLICRLWPSTPPHHSVWRCYAGYIVISVVGAPERYLWEGRRRPL
jgi:hypothetical protein